MVELPMIFTGVSDEALIASLRALCAESQLLVARMVVYLGEVEERSLHLKAACSSMFDFCVRKLGMSEGAAHRRINAARLVRRFPSLFGGLERGEVQLSGLVLLAKHLTEENVDEVLAAVAGKSQREVESFLACYAPKPDVPERISKLTPVEPQAPLVVGGPNAQAAPVAGPRRIEALSEDRF